MSSTKVKVDRNLAGLQFLITRPDILNIQPDTDHTKILPSFSSRIEIMKDNMTIVVISLRVDIRTFHSDGEETYTLCDVVGTGTTFEMALFDLSAKLISIVNENQIIDISLLPLVEKTGGKDGKSLRAIKSFTSDTSSVITEQDKSFGVATGSSNSGRNGANGKRNSANKRQPKK